MRCTIVVTVLVVTCCVICTGRAFAQNCPEADPTDLIPDRAAIQACLDRGGEVVLVPGSPGYIIDDRGAGLPALVFRPNNTRLTSIGGKARLLAHADLAGRIFDAQDTNFYEISEIIFDGNRANRTQSWRCFGVPYAGQFGTNALVKGTGYHVINVDTINAMCGSGLEVSGTGYQIFHVQAENNGTEAPAGPWADGITIVSCDGGDVGNNWAINNTDIGLVIFSGLNNCGVHHNLVSQSLRYAFAAMSVGDNRPGTNLFGTNVFSNTIQVGLDMATYGLHVGSHGETPMPFTIDHVGTVTNNSISGAVVNLAVDGMVHGFVNNNFPSNPQGSRGLPCGTSANYTAAHFGDSTLDPNPVCWYYHDGCGCAP